jgi:hypothetical protein
MEKTYYWVCINFQSEESSNHLESVIDDHPFRVVYGFKKHYQEKSQNTIDVVLMNYKEITEEEYNMFLELNKEGNP